MQKIKKQLNKYFPLAIIFFMVNCSNGLVKREVFLRVVSPDETVDAVIYKTNSGATSSFGYQIYIVPHGKEPDFKNMLFRADHIKNLSVEWRSGKILNIVYDEARIFHFTNFWHSKEVQNFSYVVEKRRGSPFNFFY